MKPIIPLGALILTCFGTSCMTKMETIASGCGPEDLCPVKVDGRDGILTATAHRRIAQLGSKHPHGALELFVPGRDSAFKVIFPNATQHGSPLFPTGICKIDGVRGRSSQQLIYVANSFTNPSKSGGSVEVFSLAGEHATYLGKLGPEDLPANPNGIAVAPDGAVYVSAFQIVPKCKDAPCLDPSAPKGSATNSIYCFRPGNGSLLDGKWTRVASGFNGANGLAMNAEGTTLLACSYHSRNIWLMKRNPINGALTGKPTPLALELDFHPDNLKHLGKNRFTVCGQKSLGAAALNLACNLPVSPGGAIAFTLTDGKATDVLRLTDRMKSNRNSPTTALEIGGDFYFGHVITKGVSRLRGSGANR